MAKKPVASNDGYQKLKNDLRAKQPERCYVFHGEEAYLREHYLNMLKKQLLDALTEGFNYHRLTVENFSVAALIESVEAYPMMAERSLVQVDEINLFDCNEDERNRLIDLLTHLPEHCCLIFLYETTPFKPDKRQKKLWEALSGNSTIVEFQKQGERELSDWIAKHFAVQGKQIAPDLCRYLIARTGGAMTTLGSEISKISSYCDSAQISKADIDAVVEPVLEAVVFDISNAIAESDFAQALLKLQTLFQMQEEPIPIAGAIGSQMRRLLAARILMDSGKGADSLMQLCSLSSYPASQTMKHARRLPYRFCKQAVLLCLQADERLKSGFDDPKHTLELLILQLAQEARA